MLHEKNAFDWCLVLSINMMKVIKYGHAVNILGSLSNSVFERRTSTGSCFFAPLSRDLEQIFGQIVSIRVKTLSNTNLVASTHIKREKRSLPVDLCRSKTSLLKLPCLDATKFVLLRVFTLIETIFPKICLKSRLKSAKSLLPVDVRRSKTSLLKLRIVSPPPPPQYCHHYC